MALRPAWRTSAQVWKPQLSVTLVGQLQVPLSLWPAEQRQVDLWQTAPAVRHSEKWVQWSPR